VNVPVVVVCVLEEHRNISFMRNENVAVLVVSCLELSTSE
jgi:hypothetical protein